MAINLDSYDTNIPPGGIEVELRGEKFQIRKQHVSEAWLPDYKYSNEEEMKKGIAIRLFEVEVDSSGAPAVDEDGHPVSTAKGMKEFERFYDHMTSVDKKANKSAMCQEEILKLVRTMTDVSRGFIDEDGKPIPKGRGSAHR